MQLLLSLISFAALFRRACDFAERGMSSQFLKCMPRDCDEIDEGWTSAEVTFPANILYIRQLSL